MLLININRLNLKKIETVIGQYQLENIMKKLLIGLLMLGSLSVYSEKSNRLVGFKSIVISPYGNASCDQLESGEVTERLFVRGYVTDDNQTFNAEYRGPETFSLRITNGKELQILTNDGGFQTVAHMAKESVLFPKWAKYACEHGRDPGNHAFDNHIIFNIDKDVRLVSGARGLKKICKVEMYDGVRGFREYLTKMIFLDLDRNIVISSINQNLGNYDRCVTIKSIANGIFWAIPNFLSDLGPTW